MKSVKFNPLTSLVMAAALAIGLTACGGGDSATKTDAEIAAEKLAADRAAAKMACEDAGGRSNSDHTCTTAGELEATAITSAIASAKMAADALTAESSNDDVAAAEALVTTAHRAITGADHASAANTATNLTALAAIRVTLASAKMAVAERMEAEARVPGEMEATRISNAISAAKMAADALTSESSSEDVDAAEALATTAQVAITRAEHATAADTASNLTALAAVRRTVATARTAVAERMRIESAKADRVSAQKTALMTAAAGIDTSELMTAEDISAANTAIASLRMALTAAVDVSDADKAMYQSQLNMAMAAVTTAQGALNHTAQTMVLSDAVKALEAIDLSGLSDQAQIDAAKAAIDNLRMALAAATELSDADKAVATTALSTADRTVVAAQTRFDIASQMTTLAEAAAALGAINLGDLMTQEKIDAANKAIAMLDLALEMATNLTAAQKLDAQTDVTVAKRRVMAAETDLAENIGSQRMALTEAGSALADLDLEDLSDQGKIDAANDAVEALKMALANATHLSDSTKAMYQTQLDTATETVRTAQTGMDRDGRMTAQRTAITDAVTAARAAVGMVDDDATDEQVTAADNALAALKAAIDGAADLEGDSDVAKAQGALDSLMPVLASAKMSRTDAIAAKAEADEKAEEEEARKASAAMAATAAKLFAAISPASGDNTTLTPEARAAQINPVSGNDPTPFISVNYGGELETAGEPNSATLNLDKDTPVADHGGWEGNRYVEEDDGKIITEAVVYSDEMPMMGAKFNGGETGDGAVGFGLNDAGALVFTDDLDIPSRIASPRFTHTAGTHTFELPEDNPGGLSMLNFTGSYYGVAGTYTCTPGDGASACGVARAANGGYTFVTPTSWTFKPTDPNARVTEMADTNYAVYGWWLRTPATGAWTASAFAGYYGTPVDIAGLDALNGSATYTGGAAGKYALSSTTGGDNDAGHFTARATLDADFDAEMISGTVDQFMSDGEAKDWSVALNKSGFSAVGQILGGAGEDDSTPMKTVWTRDGKAAAASGHWKGNFREVGDSGVPKVVTGDFYSEFGNSGKMVGGFGAKTE